jgi:hypothetical protein
VTTSLNKKNVIIIIIYLLTAIRLTPGGIGYIHVDVAHIQDKINATLGCLERPRHRQWENMKMDVTETG